ncbi:MAG TPA: hypothetical protein VG841_12275 [Caulobacterales bacterium]|nr:hypothetical protein [Caulobacterales bacterium]
MTNRIRAGVGAALLCALCFGAAACGGGGSGGAAEATAPQASGEAVSATAASTTTSTVRPTLYLDRDPDGARYIRVEEPRYDPFAGTTPGQSLVNRTTGPAAGVSNNLVGNVTTLVSNVDVTGMKYGVDLMGTNKTSIYDFSYVRWQGGGDIYGSAIKIGGNDRSTNGSTYIQRVFADAMQQPDPSYTISNTEFLGVEYEDGPIFVRDVTGRHFGDAGIDTKSGPVYVMNATLSEGHRMLRVWPGVTLVIANSIINASAGQTQIWIGDATASVQYYNTLWCVGATTGTASDPHCRTKPWVIEGNSISSAEAAQRVTALNTNPLPSKSVLFTTQIDQIVIQASANGGSSWTTLSFPNAGRSGSPPIGDTRYRIPAGYTAATCLFRAYYMKGGAKTGVTSRTMNGSGAYVN